MHFRHDAVDTRHGRRFVSRDNVDGWRSQFSSSSSLSIPKWNNSVVRMMLVVDAAADDVPTIALVAWYDGTTSLHIVLYHLCHVTSI